MVSMLMCFSKVVTFRYPFLVSKLCASKVGTLRYPFLVSTLGAHSGIRYSPV